MGSDSEDMALQMKRFLLGYLEMWIFSTRLVLTFWFVTIGMFWSLTFGGMVEPKNKNRRKYSFKTNKENLLYPTLATRDTCLESDQRSTEFDKINIHRQIVNLETNNNSTLIPNERPIDTEFMNNNG